MDTLLSIRGLTVRLDSRGPGEARPLHGVSLDVWPGEALGLLGESGSGKTTLARTILRILPPTARVETGAVLFRGVDLLTLPSGRLDAIRGGQISMVFQEPALSLNPFRRAIDQVVDVLTAHRDGGARLRNEAGAVLADVGLAEARLARAYPHEMSGGQRQRLAIAVALACRPALLLADEPTSSLDAAQQADFLALLASLRERYHLALLFISHDPACLARLVGRIAVLREGRLVEEAPVAQLFAQPRHEYTRSLLSSAADAA